VARAAATYRAQLGQAFAEKEARREGVLRWLREHGVDPAEVQGGTFLHGVGATRVELARRRRRVDGVFRCAR
jgi:hypothetical protein